ncbi:hypothetical protein BH23PLA1_BH23PLA1_11590 [soil metagenome]
MMTTRDTSVLHRLVLNVSIFVGVALLAMVAVPLWAQAKAEPESEAADRGRIALTKRSFLSPEWSLEAYRKAAEHWEELAPDPNTDPVAYAEAFRQRLGLHPAPYPNDGLPMGLRLATSKDGSRTGLQIDCMVCHGGSIGGQSYLGLGNTQLDMGTLYEDLYAADGRPLGFIRFTVNTARGTVNAGQMSATLLSLRNRDLSKRKFPLPLGSHFAEIDTPAWWNLKHKKTMYQDGRTDSDSVRSLMQFMLAELTIEEFEELEPTFKDIQAYLKSLEPPIYPFEIDRPLAERGRVLFEASCANCHGTYGPGGEYPNRIVELDIIGTDPVRALAPSDLLVAHYNATWFAEHEPVDEQMVGYQAPPLDGIWATAPYLHNGSVPTLFHLLQSKERPDRYTRPPSTDFEHYDTRRVGWKFETVDDETGEFASRREVRSIYDTSRRGLGNGGHTFGDDLSEVERMAVIEYLKTL